MRRLLVVFAVSLAIVALPAASRAAASSCAGTMDCCAKMGEEGAPPCSCSLNPIPPAPAAADATPAPAVVLAEAALPAVAVEAPAGSDAPRPVAPRARSAPLFLLFSVLLV